MHSSEISSKRSIQQAAHNVLFMILFAILALAQAMPANSQDFSPSLPLWDGKCLAGDVYGLRPSLANRGITLDVSSTQ